MVESVNFQGRSFDCVRRGGRAQDDRLLNINAVKLSLRQATSPLPRLRDYSYCRSRSRRRYWSLGNRRIGFFFAEPGFFTGTAFLAPLAGMAAPLAAGVAVPRAAFCFWPSLPSPNGPFARPPSLRVPQSSPRAFSLSFQRGWIWWLSCGPTLERCYPQPSLRLSLTSPTALSVLRQSSHAHPRSTFASS